MQKKTFDCIKFKRDLQEKMLKESGAKNLKEYVKYVNEAALKSPLHKAAAR